MAKQKFLSADKPHVLMVLFENAANGSELRCSYALATIDKSTKAEGPLGDKQYTIEKSGYISVKPPKGKSDFYTAATILTGYALSQVPQNSKRQAAKTTLILDSIDSYKNGIEAITEKETLDPQVSYSWPNIDPLEIKTDAPHDRTTTQLGNILTLNATDLEKQGLRRTIGSNLSQDAQILYGHAMTSLGMDLKRFKRMNGDLNSVLTIVTPQSQRLINEQDKVLRMREVTRAHQDELIKAQEALIGSEQLSTGHANIFAKALSEGRSPNTRERDELSSADPKTLRVHFDYIRAHERHMADIITATNITPEKHVRVPDGNDPDAHMLLLRKCTELLTGNPTNEAQNRFDQRVASPDF